MTIQQYMGIIKVLFCIILAFKIVEVVSIEEKKTHEEFISQLFDPTSGLLTEETAEVIWITCWEDFIHLEKEVEYLDLRLPKESYRNTNEISLEMSSIARENIQKLMNACYPQLKENVFYCLRKNNFLFDVLKEKYDSKTLHAIYMGPLSSRRYLGQVFHQHVSETPNKEDESLKKNNRKLQESDKKDKKKSKSKDSKKKDKESSSSSMAIIIIVTILGVVAIILCCRFCGSGRVSQNDERPLLSMSMNEYSVGSSSNNNPFKNSMKEEKSGLQSSKSTLFGDKNSMKETQLGSAATVPSFELKPPPGRVGSGMLPLKPPPGRPDLLPPEPCPIEPSDDPIIPPPPPPPKLRSGSQPPPPPPTDGQGTLPPSPPGNGPTPPPPPPTRTKVGPRPPPPPRAGGNGGLPRGPLPFGSKNARTPEEVGTNSESEVYSSNKAKLKPFFWDKVQANSDQTMVWNQLRAGSFQFNEEMMETLFCYNATTNDKGKGQQKKEANQGALPQYIQIIDSKKSQNLSILLKALNVTIEEVCDALFEGNELPTEFLHTLLKMAPTLEEEHKLRLFTGNVAQLGPADRFLKALVDIPFSFKRMETLLYMGTLQEELTNAREAFTVLEVACQKLKSSRLFLKLLEAVLKTGNRMNDGTFRGGAQAFKLDTLLKLSDVKGVDGKTTLLHFVVQEIIRTEGIRAARMAKENHSFSSVKTEDLLEDISIESEDQYRELGLQTVSRLSTELENVKKAAAIDADGLIGTTSRLGHGLIKTRDFVNKDPGKIEDDKGFHETVKSFVEKAEVDVTSLLEEEKKIMALVKRTGDYFHGDAGKDEGLRLFIIVRDFLLMLDKVCKEIKSAQLKKPVVRNNVKQETSNHSRKSSSSEILPLPPDIRQKIFPAVANRRVVDDFSSDDDCP